MHRSFADWYSQASLTFDGDMLELRWSAIELFVKKLDSRHVPDLIRMFYSRPTSDSFKEELRLAAKEIDKTFLMNKDDAELSILAGGAIALTVSGQGSKIADSVALGVSCMEAKGLRRVGRIQGVVDDASAYLTTESIRIREVSELPPIVTVDVAKALTALKASTADPEAFSVAGEMAFRNLTTGLEAFDEAIRRVVDDLNNQEQSNILWWLFGERTLDQRIKFQDMTVGEACFKGADDLQSLTTVLPGPRAAAAFLARVVRLAKVKLSVADCVEAFHTIHNTPWGFSSVDHLADCCPLLYGISKCTEAGAGEWSGAFSKQTGLRSKDMLAPNDMAHQIYQEMLFFRSLGD